MKRNFAVMGSAFLLCAAAQADVKLPMVFSDNMIFQRGVQAPVWGEAAPGENVKVQFAGQTKEVTAGADGSWMVRLDPLTVAESATLQINGANEVKINNVAVGEVWIASGQSNMEFGMGGAHNAAEALAVADDPQLRLFTFSRAPATEPQKDVKNGRWQPSNPTSARGFSAVGYFFGRELRRKMPGIPIGVIHTSWGGTPAEAWTSMPALQAEPDFKPMLDGWDKRMADYPAQMEKFTNEVLTKWEEDKKKAKDEGKTEPRRPGEPQGPLNQNRPANLYNGMIAPFVPFASHGAIWYQGESNAGRAYQYRKLLPAMIADWRTAWGVQKPQDFAFYIVQLANYMAEKPEPAESAWAELREAQTMTANMPGNGQGLAIDVGEAGDIHPKNKQDVGIRLALAALAQTYGQNIEYSGPVYDSMKKDGNKIRLKFTHADGLMSKADPISAFAIAGEDKKWKWANAKIEGNEIVVSNDEIADPVAVRYAWADNPKATIYNAAGLPAVPFRTDDWPMITLNNK